MRHNKVLGLAIASALALGANSSFGGSTSLTIKYQDASCTFPLKGSETAPATFASELFFAGDQTILSGFGCGGADDLDNVGMDGPAALINTTSGGPDEGYFYAIYKFDTKALGKTPFLARFQLSNGAQFGKDISLGSATNLDFVAHPSGTHAGVTKSGALGNGGSKGDTQTTFYITPTGENGFIKNQDTLVLRFNLKNVGVLKTPNEKIDMTAEVFSSENVSSSFDGGADTATVANSVRATKADVSSVSGSAEIDVAQESKIFVGSSSIVKSPTKVLLGSLYITNNTSVTALNADGTPWTFDPDANPAGGTLTLENATLSASANDPGKVFLDFDNNYEYNTTDPIKPDLKATTVKDGNTAIWDLTSAQLKALYKPIIASTDQGVGIMIETDGATPIEEQREAAKATFEINYGGDNIDRFSRKLVHIKRNGVVCSIYNVPAPDAMDTGNIRITNTSSLDGKVFGTLRDKDGKYVFTNKQLVEKIVPNQTLYISTHNPNVIAPDVYLDAIPKDADWITAHGTDSWKGRGVLTINSDVKSLEVYGLVRNKAGGPLTNMSVGATGNGCD